MSDYFEKQRESTEDRRKFCLQLALKQAEIQKMRLRKCTTEWLGNHICEMAETYEHFIIMGKPKTRNRKD